MKASLLPLACAMVCLLVARQASAGEGDIGLEPLPAVDLASTDFTSEESPAIDDEEELEGELENVGDSPSDKRRHRRPARRHAQVHRFQLRLRPPRPVRRFAARPHGVRRQGKVFFQHERYVHDAPPRERESVDEGRARGGLLVTGGASSSTGLAPREGIMASGRLEVAMPLPTLQGHSSGSRWLSRGAVGVIGGFDAGSREGVDTQIWRAGVVLSMGAPWTRDFIGVALEGGVLGGHHGGEDAAAIDVRPYGLGRLTLQLPLRNDVRPFLAGELGVTDATRGDGLAGIAGIHAGVVWNAW